MKLWPTKDEMYDGFVHFLYINYNTVVIVVDISIVYNLRIFIYNIVDV